MVLNDWHGSGPGGKKALSSVRRLPPRCFVALRRLSLNIHLSAAKRRQEKFVSASVLFMFLIYF